MQNRTALEAHRSAKQLIFDLDQDTLMDWSKTELDENNAGNFSPAQTVMALNTMNIENPESPIILMLLSNQHTINDYLSNPASEELARQGYTVSVLEYPNYGTSLGLASTNSWLAAIRGAVTLLNHLTGRKIILSGHSIGGPLAIQAVAHDDMVGKIGGVISYGGFANLFEMGKDNVSSKVLKFFSKLVVKATLKKNIIDGVGSLEKVSQSGIPSLIMHGEKDGAVPVRHLDLYKHKVTELVENGKINQSLVQTVQFPDLYHEEINNF